MSQVLPIVVIVVVFAVVAVAAYWLGRADERRRARARGFSELDQALTAQIGSRPSLGRQIESALRDARNEQKALSKQVELLADHLHVAFVFEPPQPPTWRLQRIPAAPAGDQGRAVVGAPRE